MFFSIGFEGGTSAGAAFPDEFFSVPDGGDFGVFLLSVFVIARCFGDCFEVLFNGALPDFLAIVVDGPFSIDDRSGKFGLGSVLVGLGLFHKVGQVGICDSRVTHGETCGE